MGADAGHGAAWAGDVGPVDPKVFGISSGDAVLAIEQREGIDCLRGEKDFIIHSQWREEAAFDAHAELPRMKRFFGLVEGLIPHLVQAMRCKRLG